jgi:hypothetical protein
VPSAVNPLRVAIETALNATAAGERVFDSEAQRDTPLPYIVFGTASEDEGGFYAKPGSNGSIQIKFWAEDSWAAQELYEQGKTALHRVALTVAGHTLVRGTLSRLTDFAEPDPEIGGHVVVGVYRTETLEA